MRFTKQELNGAAFHARGRWYDAREVDDFLDKMAVAADEAQRRLENAERRAQDLARRVKFLEEENGRLQRQASAAEARQGSRDLEQERSRLLQDIKALRSFRESFRKAVERDAASLAEQTRRLDSDRLLEGRKG